LALISVIETACWGWDPGLCPEFLFLLKVEKDFMAATSGFCSDVMEVVTEVFARLPGDPNGECNLADPELLSELMVGELRLLEPEELDPNKAPNEEVMLIGGIEPIEPDFFFLSIRLLDFSVLDFSISFGTELLRGVVIIFFHEIMSRAILMRLFEFNKKKLNKFEKIW